MPIHEVKTGECVAKIAAERGLPWAKIWNHVNNADLREIRKDPNILLAGDELFVPDRVTRSETCASNQSHQFILARKALELRMRLVDGPFEREPSEPEAFASQAPIVNTADQTLGPVEYRARKRVPYRLEVGSQVLTGHSDDEGMVTCSIDATATHGRLVLNPGSAAEETMSLKFGALDPLSEDAGILERLHNLGLAREGEALEHALRRFQKLHSLDPSGTLDDPTRTRLHELHGS